MSAAMRLALKRVGDADGLYGIDWLLRPMRLVLRFLGLALVSFGPYAPVLILLVFVAPPLVLISGWPAWLGALMLVNDVVVVVAIVLVAGPAVRRELVAQLEEERRS
jgi:hypothetical protein